MVSTILLVSFIVSSSDVALALAPSGRVEDKNFQQAYSALDSNTRALDAIGESLYLKMPIAGVRELVKRRVGVSVPLSVDRVQDGAVYFSFKSPDGSVKYFRCFKPDNEDAIPGAVKLSLPGGRLYCKEELPAPDPFSAESLLAVRERISGYIIETPLVELPILGRMTGKTVLLKEEPRQIGGSFKTRGVTYEVFKAIQDVIDRDPDLLKKGLRIVTQTDGNHGGAMIRAVTSAIREFSERRPDLKEYIRKIEPVVFTFKKVSAVKLEAMKQAMKEYRAIAGDTRKGSIELVEGDYADALKARTDYIAGYGPGALYMEHGGIDIMQGHATASIEIAEQLKARGVSEDKKVCLIIPVGAGGPIGLAEGLKKFRTKNTTVIMVQSSRYGAFVESFKSGKLAINKIAAEESPYTVVVDGVRYIYEDGIAVDGPESQYALDKARRYIDDAVLADPQRALDNAAPLVLADLDRYYASRGEGQGVVGGTTAITADALLNVKSKFIDEADVVVLFATEGNVEPGLINYTRKRAEKLSPDPAVEPREKEVLISAMAFTRSILAPYRDTASQELDRLAGILDKENAFERAALRNVLRNHFSCLMYSSYLSVVIINLNKELNIDIDVEFIGYPGRDGRNLGHICLRSVKSGIIIDPYPEESSFREFSNQPSGGSVVLPGSELYDKHYRHFTRIDDKMVDGLVTAIVPPLVGALQLSQPAQRDFFNGLSEDTETFGPHSLGAAEAGKGDPFREYEVGAYAQKIDGLQDAVRGFLDITLLPHNTRADIWKTGLYGLDELKIIFAAIACTKDVIFDEWRFKVSLYALQDEEVSELISYATGQNILEGGYLYSVLTLDRDYEGRVEKYIEKMARFGGSLKYRDAPVYQLCAGLLRHCEDVDRSIYKDGRPPTNHDEAFTSLKSEYLAELREIRKYGDKIGHAVHGVRDWRWRDAIGMQRDDETQIPNGKIKFMNVVLEGNLRSLSAFSRLKADVGYLDTRHDTSFSDNGDAGTYGPFYVILEKGWRHDDTGGIGEAYHKNYLVPNDKVRDFLISGLEAALAAGLIDRAGMELKKNKIVTYREYLNILTGSVIHASYPDAIPEHIKLVTETAERQNIYGDEAIIRLYEGIRKRSGSIAIGPDSSDATGKEIPGYSMATGRRVIPGAIPKPLADQARSEISIAILGAITGGLASIVSLVYSFIFDSATITALRPLIFWSLTSAGIGAIIIINLFFSERVVVFSQKLYKKIESVIFTLHKEEVLDNKNTLGLLENAIYQNSVFQQKEIVRKVVGSKHALISILKKPSYRNIAQVLRRFGGGFTHKQIRAIRDDTVRALEMAKTVDPFYFSSKDNPRTFVIALKIMRASSLSIAKKISGLFLLKHLSRIANGETEKYLASLGITPDFWGEAKTMLDIKRRIKEMLAESAASGYPRYVYLTGDSKVGKTTLMKLIEEADLDNGEKAMAFINMDKVYEDNDRDMESSGEMLLGAITRDMISKGKRLFIIDGRDAHMLEMGGRSKNLYINITADDATRLENIIRTDFGVSALSSRSQVPEGALELNFSRQARPSEAEIYSVLSGRPVIHFPKFIKSFLAAWIMAGAAINNTYAEPSSYIYTAVSVALYISYLVITDGFGDMFREMIKKSFADKYYGRADLPEKDKSIRREGDKHMPGGSPYTIFEYIRKSRRPVDPKDIAKDLGLSLEHTVMRDIYTLKFLGLVKQADGVNRSKTRPYRAIGLSPPLREKVQQALKALGNRPSAAQKKECREYLREKLSPAAKSVYRSAKVVPSPVICATIDEIKGCGTLSIVVNPGSTSNTPGATGAKVGIAGVIGGEFKLFETDIEVLNATKDTEKDAARVTGAILEFLQKNAIELKSISTVCGRGGLLKPTNGGLIRINNETGADGRLKLDQAVWRDLVKDPLYKLVHESNMGALIVDDIASRVGDHGVPAFILDPVTTYALDPVFRHTGRRESENIPIWHALNCKAVIANFGAYLTKTRHAAEPVKPNAIVVHMGGGTTVAAFRDGIPVRVTNALAGSGVMSVKRGQPQSVIDIINTVAPDLEAGSSVLDASLKAFCKSAGMEGYVGTNSLMVVENLIAKGKSLEVGKKIDIDDKLMDRLTSWPGLDKQIDYAASLLKTQAESQGINTDDLKTIVKARVADFVLDILAHKIVGGIGDFAVTAVKRPLDGVIFTGGGSKCDLLTGKIADIIKESHQGWPLYVSPGSLEQYAMARESYRAAVLGEIVPSVYGEPAHVFPPERDPWADIKVNIHRPKRVFPIKDPRDILTQAKKLPPKSIVIAEPNDISIESVLDAAEAGIINKAYFTGDGPKIERLMAQYLGRVESLEGRGVKCEILHIEPAGDKAANSQRYAIAAIKLVKDNKADFVMKGGMDTGVMLKELLKKEGLGAGRLASYVTVTTSEVDGRTIISTDAAINVRPAQDHSPQIMVDIIQNAVNTALILGIEPRVAIISGNEKVVPKLPYSVLSKKLADLPWPEGVTVDGPISWDVAFNPASAEEKDNYEEGSEALAKALASGKTLKDVTVRKIAGTATIEVETGFNGANATYKKRGVKASSIIGAAVPSPLASRGDPAENKLLSMALSILILESEKAPESGRGPESAGGTEVPYEAKSEPVDDVKTAELPDLNIRAARALEWGEVSTVGELKRRWPELISRRNFAMKSFNEIQSSLSELKTRLTISGAVFVPGDDVPAYCRYVESLIEREGLGLPLGRYPRVVRSVMKSFGFTTVSGLLECGVSSLTERGMNLSRLKQIVEVFMALKKEYNLKKNEAWRDERLEPRGDGMDVPAEWEDRAKVILTSKIIDRSETFVFDARTKKSVPAVLETTPDRILLKVGDEIQGTLKYYFAEELGRYRIIVDSVRSEDQNQYGVYGRRYEDVGLRLIEEAVRLSMRSKAEGGFYADQEEKNFKAEGFFDKLAEKPDGLRWKTRDNSIIWYLEPQGAQKFLDLLERRMETKKAAFMNRSHRGQSENDPVAVKSWEDVLGVLEDAPEHKYSEVMKPGLALFRGVGKRRFGLALEKKAVGPVDTSGHSGESATESWWGEPNIAISTPVGLDDGMRIKFNPGAVCVVFEISDKIADEYGMSAEFNQGMTHRDIPLSKIRRAWAVRVDSRQSMKRGVVRMAEITIPGMRSKAAVRQASSSGKSASPGMTAPSAWPTANPGPYPENPYGTEDNIARNFSDLDGQYLHDISDELSDRTDPYHSKKQKGLPAKMLIIGVGRGLEVFQLMDSYTNKLEITSTSKEDLVYRTPEELMNNFAANLTREEAQAYIDRLRQRYLRCDLDEGIPAEDGYFDIVIIDEFTLGYVKDKYRAIREMLRVCKDGGVVYCSPKFAHILIKEADLTFGEYFASLKHPEVDSLVMEDWGRVPREKRTSNWLKITKRKGMVLPGLEIVRSTPLPIERDKKIVETPVWKTYYRPVSSPASYEGKARMVNSASITQEERRALAVFLVKDGLAVSQTEDNSPAGILKTGEAYIARMERTAADGFVAAFYNEKPAGIISYSIQGHAPGARYDSCVNDLFVDPYYRGRGIAKMLLKQAAIEMAAKGVKTVAAVVDSNPSSQDFWKSVCPERYLTRDARGVITESVIPLSDILSMDTSKGISGKFDTYKQMIGALRDGDKERFDELAAVQDRLHSGNTGKDGGVSKWGTQPRGVSQSDTSSTTLEVHRGQGGDGVSKNIAAPASTSIDELYKMIVFKTGREIVSLDISECDAVLAALKSGKVVALDLSKLGDNYNEAYYRLGSIADIVTTLLIGREPPLMHRTSVNTAEILKNAFVHGNKGNFNYPIFINITPSNNAGYATMQVYDVAAEEIITERVRFDMEEALLSGPGLGEDILGENGSYKRLSVSNGAGKVVGTMASIDFPAIADASRDSHSVAIIKGDTQPRGASQRDTSLATRSPDDERPRFTGDTITREDMFGPDKSADIPNLKISGIDLPVTQSAMKGIEDLASMRDIKFSKNITNFLKLSYETTAEKNKSIAIRWKHPVYDGETELIFDLDTGKMIRGVRKAFGKAERIDGDEVTSMISDGILKVVFDSKKGGVIVYDIIISLGDSLKAQKAEMAVSSVVEYDGYGIVLTDHATGKEVLSQLVIPDNKRTIFINSILKMDEDRAFVSVLGDALRNSDGDVYLKINDGRPKLCAHDGNFGYGEIDVFFIYNRMADLLSDSVIKRFFNGRSRDTISDDDVAQLLYERPNEKIGAKRSGYWRNLVTPSTVVTTDIEGQYIEELINEASAGQEYEIIHLHIHPSVHGAGLCYFMPLGEKIYEPKYLSSLQDAAGIPSAADVRAAIRKQSLGRRYSKVFGIVYWKYNVDPDKKSIKVEGLPSVAFYYLPAFLANDNFAISVMEFVEKGMYEVKNNKDMITVLDAFFTGMDSIRMAISPIEPEVITRQSVETQADIGEDAPQNGASSKVTDRVTQSVTTVRSNVMTPDELVEARAKSAIEALNSMLNKEGLSTLVKAYSIHESNISSGRKKKEAIADLLKYNMSVFGGLESALRHAGITDIEFYSDGLINIDGIGGLKTLEAALEGSGAVEVARKAVTEAAAEHPDGAIEEQVARAEECATMIKMYVDDIKKKYMAGRLESQKIVVGIETEGWVSKAQQDNLKQSDVVHKIQQVIGKMERRGIIDKDTVRIVYGDSEHIAGNVAAAQKDIGAPMKNTAVLGSEKTLISSGKFDEFKGKAFLVCVEPVDMEKLTYVRLFEMLTIVTKLALGREAWDAVRAEHSDIAIEKISESIARLIPSEKAFAPDAPRDLYNLQVKKFEDQA